MANSGAVLKAWWRDPVDYRWLVATFESHSALGPTRVVIASGGAVLLLITMLTTLSPAGPRGIGAHVVDGFVGLVCILWVLRWALRRWPSETESLLMFAFADLLITVVCLLDRNRVYGSLGAILLVVTGGYFALFHGPRVLALHTAWSLVSVVLLAVLLVTDNEAHDVALALAIVLIMIAATVVVMPTLQFSFWLVRTDAVTDPLTMLLNRRGLDYRLSRWLTLGDQATICVMAVDLDRFKAVNDNFGHAVGDQVLTQTAFRIRAEVGHQGLVARTGGEEFVVVVRLANDEAMAAAERLRRSIASRSNLPVNVTASIGVALLDPAAADRPPTALRPDHLLRSADAAMYCAKRAGGNRVAYASKSAETAPARPGPFANF